MKKRFEECLNINERIFPRSNHFAAIKKGHIRSVQDMVSITDGFEQTNCFSNFACYFFFLMQGTIWPKFWTCYSCWTYICIFTISWRFQNSKWMISNFLTWRSQFNGFFSESELFVSHWTLSNVTNISLYVIIDLRKYSLMHPLFQVDLLNENQLWHDLIEGLILHRK